MTTILVSAGDLSGERHAAELVKAIRARIPATRFIGMGGASMSAAGVELVVDQRELAVGGFSETFTSVPRIVRAWLKLVKSVDESNPELVILVDSGGFNLPFARRVGRSSRAKVLYYIAPQVWAWRRRRLTAIASRSDRIAVILPFERDYYASHGVEVDFVGHPILDHSSAMDLTDPALKERARERIGIDSKTPVLGLFPGSRRNEVDQHLELWINAYLRLKRFHPDLQAVLSRAPTLDAADCARRVQGLAGGEIDSIHVVSGENSDGIDAVDVALAKPGTITLELLLRGCPMVVAGRANWITARIIRRSLEVPFVGLPNLLMGKEIVPECLQEEANPDRIADLLRPLLAGEGRASQIAQLYAARDRLGGAGASQRGARIVEEMLGHLEA